MNRLLIIFALLPLLLLVAACGSDDDTVGGGELTQSPAPGVTLSSLEQSLASVLLEESDLPPGLQGTAPIFSTNDDLAADSERLATIIATGRRLGVDVQFIPTDQLDPDYPVRGGIQSAASIYESPLGASETFLEAVGDARANDWAANYPSLTDVTVTEISRDVGEESVWLRVSGTAECEFIVTPVPGEGPTPTCSETKIVVLDNVLFRQGRVRGFLQVSGLFPPVSAQDVFVDQVLQWVELMTDRAQTAFP